MSLFSTLGFDDSILAMLTEEGYTTPTDIQAQAIPPALAGKDVLGIAQTGTGKTAAFALPIIQKLRHEKLPKKLFEPRALVLSPTRELAAQIAESFATYGRGTGLRHTVVFGGVSQYHQERALERGVDILVATPGRLIDLINQGIISLAHIHTFVLDEADRMLDMGFIEPIREIASMLSEKRQTLLFSATMPQDISDLAGSLLNKPVRVAVHAVASAAPKIEQLLYQVPRERKFALLGHILKDPLVKRVLVFMKTKHGSDKITKRLRACGEKADAIHGNKAQSQRTRALDGFRSGRVKVLVATDVAARGLDVDGITHVINFDLPIDAEAYVHRIGRTGRAGAFGMAIAFCDDSERNLLRNVERLIRKPIPRGKLPADLPDMKPLPGSMLEEPVGGDSGGHRGGRRSRSHRSERDAGPSSAERPKRSRQRVENKPQFHTERMDMPEDVSVRKQYPPSPTKEHSGKTHVKKSFAERAFEKRAAGTKPFEKKPFAQFKDHPKKHQPARTPHPFQHHGASGSGSGGVEGEIRQQTGGHVGFGKRGGFKKAGLPSGGFKSGGFKSGGFKSGGFKSGGFKSGGFKKGGFKKSGFQKPGGHR